MPKFCANISLMFTEHPFLQRYTAAREAGFKAVESGFPFGFQFDDIVKAKQDAGIDQVLINIYTGDVSKGEVGFAALPDKEKEFKNSLEQTIKLAKALNVKKIHIMAGKIIDNNKPELGDTCYETNLRFAAEELRKVNMIGLIEPISAFTIPSYYMNDYAKAYNVVQKINHPHLRLMLDTFHMQNIHGNVDNIETYAGAVGHVQIAQTPDRHEPDVNAEIDYKSVLKRIEKIGYTDWIGLEYKPKGSTVDGMKWITDYGYTL